MLAQFHYISGHRYGTVTVAALAAAAAGLPVRLGTLTPGVRGRRCGGTPSQARVGHRGMVRRRRRALCRPRNEPSISWSARRRSFASRIARNGDPPTADRALALRAQLLRTRVRRRRTRFLGPSALTHAV